MIFGENRTSALVFDGLNRELRLKLALLTAQLRSVFLKLGLPIALASFTATASTSASTLTLQNFPYVQNHHLKSKSTYPLEIITKIYSVQEPFSI